ncbi:ROK family protein [Nonomuraea sp. NPDC049419]|uniref:ROK family protein n=1 Tax=Nonomuraea sp. NPDC049419 TaxID=3155772 RepID=UPI00344AF520
MTYVAAIDVGGTTMKGGLVARDGTILHLERRTTPRAEGPEHVIAAISRFAADLTRPWDGSRTPSPGLGTLADGTRPVAVGLAVPGLVSPTHAVFSAAFGWRDVPAAAFADVNLPVALGHDVRSAGEAELAYGGGEAHVLYLPIGTGIAGAVVPSGALYGGAGGWAGQIGHVPVWPDGLACGCGQAGCLAAYASGSAVAARCGVPAAEDVVRLAARGDARATAVWAEAVEALALALATYTLVLDPAAVVIGGGVSQAGDALVVPLRERLAARLAFRPAPDVRTSRLGPLAGLLGAALLGWSAQG